MGPKKSEKNYILLLVTGGGGGWGVKGGLTNVKLFFFFFKASLNVSLLLTNCISISFLTTFPSIMTINSQMIRINFEKEI